MGAAAAVAGARLLRNAMEDRAGFVYQIPITTRLLISTSRHTLMRTDPLRSTVQLYSFAVVP